MRVHSPSRIWLLLTFVISVAYVLSIEQLMRPLTPDGVHFHPWSSEDMMQTVSLRELRREPMRSLLNIHIQPPAFDAVRAILASFWPRLSDQEALLHVDLWLQVLGGLLLALMVTLVFGWLASKSGVVAGVVGALLLLLHPASIMFATFMDSTMLSAFLILCGCYLLWRIAHEVATPVLLFSAVALGLFFTRSVFQWPALILLGLCLLLVRARPSHLWVYVLVTGLISTVYLAKQYRQFGILSTSSFSGVSLANSIGVGLGTAKYAAYLQNGGSTTQIGPRMPRVLSSPTKIDGQPNFNHIDYLSLNRQLSNRYVDALRHDSVADLTRNYLENASIYFRPSSSYSSDHIIVDHLPWRAYFDRLFSEPVLPVLLMVAFLVWAVRAFKANAVSTGLGVLLPWLFVMFVSIIADKGENMRFKYFVEPVMIVFLVSQTAACISCIDRAWRRRPPRTARSSIA